MKPMEGAGSYTELYKTPHGYEAGKNLKEVTWTQVPILARYRAGLIQYLKTRGILYGTR
jgi:hypothetical protein